MPVSASRIAFPRLGSFSNIVDVIVATDDQVDTVRILHPIFVGHRSQLICECDILLVSYIPMTDGRTFGTRQWVRAIMMST